MCSQKIIINLVLHIASDTKKSSFISVCIRSIKFIVKVLNISIFPIHLSKKFCKKSHVTYM